jgi:hypothetical protein
MQLTLAICASLFSVTLPCLMFLRIKIKRLGHGVKRSSCYGVVILADLQVSSSAKDSSLSMVEGQAVILNYETKAGPCAFEIAIVIASSLLKGRIL